MSTEMISIAIQHYFREERAEMLIIIICSIGVTVLAGCLYAGMKDDFSRSFGVAVVVITVILSGTALSLLMRDSRHSEELLTAVQTAQARPALEAEVKRIEVIISKYPLYRYSALGITALALIGMLITRDHLTNGVAAGIFLFLVGQMMIDHYSETRASRYLQSLQVFIPDRQDELAELPSP